MASFETEVPTLRQSTQVLRPFSNTVLAEDTEKSTQEEILELEEGLRSPKEYDNGVEESQLKVKKGKAFWRKFPSFKVICRSKSSRS